MTIPVAFPIDTTIAFEVISTEAQGGVINRRQRFPWANAFRSWRLRFGPATYSDLETDVLADIRTAMGGAALVSLAVPGVGTVNGFFGDTIEWTNQSPTAHYITVDFREEAQGAI